MTDGHDISIAAAKASPPVAVITATASGLSLEDWVFVATLVYLVVQIAYLLWKWVRDIRTSSDA